MNNTNDGRSMRLFLGCFVSLIATAFGFAVRGAILMDWQKQFELSNEQLGYLAGVGLFPFAISIILWSFVIDRVGYGRAMVFAFVGHVASAIMTIFATNFVMLYVATFIFALANGTVEAVINPVVASVYEKNKTHWLNILHAGWPGGLVLGGLLAIVVLKVGGDSPSEHLWRWQMALVLLPTAIYGVLLFGQKFPVQERVAAGVNYKEMLDEFGWGSAYLCFTLLIAGVNQVLVVVGVPPFELWKVAAIAVVPTICFAFYVRAFGRPMFVFLLLVMFLLATTELGTDSWIADIMRAVLGDPVKGTLFLVYTSFIMFVLRFFAGPIVERISPLGLLASSAAIAAVGLLWLSSAGSSVMLLLAAATLYGIGKTFFWPTTLGVVSEQYPKGGALMINAIAGVGMIAVGALGNPAIGFFQDKSFDQMMAEENKPLYERVIKKDQQGLFGKVNQLNQEVYPSQLTEDEQAIVDPLIVRSKQGTLAKVALLPAIMFVCYLGLIFYFQSRGGYRVQSLSDSSGK